MFKSEKEVEDRIKIYFEQECAPKVVKDESGNQVLGKGGMPLTTVSPPTVSGLALILGFKDRGGLYNYMKRGKFKDVIKGAFTRIEDYAEQQLTTGQASGAMFWLKNHGWREKQDDDLEIGKRLKPLLIGFIDGEEDENKKDIGNSRKRGCKD